VYFIRIFIEIFDDLVARLKELHGDIRIIPHTESVKGPKGEGEKI